MFKSYYPYIEPLSELYDKFGNDEFACRDTRDIIAKYDERPRADKKFLFKMLSIGGFRRASHYRVKMINRERIFYPRTYKLSSDAITSIREWKDRQTKPKRKS